MTATIAALQGELGKYYLAIRCQNKQCQEVMLLAEIPTGTSWDEQQAIKRGLENNTVRCSICLQETLISGPLLVREIR
jgi:hypothetical protein